MYKVFIENTPVFILDSIEKISLEGIYIYSSNIKDLKKSIFNWISTDKSKTPIYIIHSNPNKAFQKLFNDFDFIEAAGGIVKSNEKFLFIKRNGIWDIPKGKLELNEDPKVGAIREIEEECGISSPSINQFICITYHTYIYKGKQTIKKTFWYSLNYQGNEKLKPQLEEGISKVKWLKKSKLIKVTKNTYPSILDVLGNYFEKLTFLV